MYRPVYAMPLLTFTFCNCLFRFGLPLVVITAIDARGRSRLVAQCLMMHEDEDSYAWMWEQIQQLVGSDAFKKIEVVFTDGAPVYESPGGLPSHVVHLLCRWHIAKNNVSHLVQSHGTEWLTFTDLWSELVHASTEEAFTAKLDNMKKR